MGVELSRQDTLDNNPICSWILDFSCPKILFSKQKKIDGDNNNNFYFCFHN